MVNVGVLSYIAGGVAFLVLAALLITSWRGRLQGIYLVIAVMFNSVWAFWIAYESAYKTSSIVLIYLIEVLRLTLWVVFLLKLLGGAKRFFLSRLVIFIYAGLWVSIFWLFLFPGMSESLGGIQALFIPSMLILVIAGLELVEQIYRNTRDDFRWAVKYLCLGIGGLFAYDLFLYSYSMLFNGIDQDLWNTRGVMNALVVPLIALAAARNPEWSLDVFVSRKVVFYATGLIGAGLYLLVMAVGGYYIKYFGEGWGGVAQATFLIGALLVLLVILFSGQARASLKVFLSKHFYNYKYDYRDEWRRFIRTISSQEDHAPLLERTIKAVAQIVESPGGSIWLDHEKKELVQQVAMWNYPEVSQSLECREEPLINFLAKSGWIIDIEEFRMAPDVYDGLQLPEWMQVMKENWLIIPLKHETRLLGFLLLSKSRARMKLSWEDYDLLKLVASQAADYIVQYEANQQLMQSRQFDAYNRLTAFIMHDLKNLIHQQSLIVKNATKHKKNAAFIETAIGTVDNSVKKMKHLLDQLQGGAASSGYCGIDIASFLTEAVSNFKDKPPVPEAEIEEEVLVRVDPDRLALVVGHLIRNAQEATNKDGFVRIRLKSDKSNAIIEVSDNGCGMDKTFIRSRLFRPFDTTKGSKGMGIGVFQAREFARTSGGDLTVMSTPGLGTTFKLVLPKYAEVTKPHNGESAGAGK